MISSSFLSFLKEVRNNIINNPHNKKSAKQRFFYRGEQGFIFLFELPQHYLNLQQFLINNFVLKLLDYMIDNKIFIELKFIPFFSNINNTKIIFRSWINEEKYKGQLWLNFTEMTSRFSKASLYISCSKDDINLHSVSVNDVINFVYSLIETKINPLLELVLVFENINVGKSIIQEGKDYITFIDDLVIEHYKHLQYYIKIYHLKQQKNIALFLDNYQKLRDVSVSVSQLCAYDKLRIFFGKDIYCNIINGGSIYFDVYVCDTLLFHLYLNPLLFKSFKEVE